MNSASKIAAAEADAPRRKFRLEDRGGKADVPAAVCGAGARKSSATGQRGDPNPDRSERYAKHRRRRRRSTSVSLPDDATRLAYTTCPFVAGRLTLR